MNYIQPEMELILSANDDLVRTSDDDKLILGQEEEEDSIEW